MTHNVHDDHPHKHGPDCSHPKVRHADHVDFLHDGHLHHVHESHIDEHVLDLSASNPGNCTENHACGGHDAQHKHGAGCGHDAIPHADHVDFVVAGHLHHSHGSHCDDHGALPLA